MACACNHCESEGFTPVDATCLYAPGDLYARSMGASEEVAESFYFYMREEVSPVMALMDGYSDPTIGQTAREWPRFLRDSFWTEDLEAEEITRLQSETVSA